VPGEYRARITRGGESAGQPHTFQSLDDGQPPRPESMRSVRRLLASGVAVVTTSAGGALRGVTATSFTVVSLDPPILLACLAQTSEALTLIRSANSFAVNLLSDHQEILAERFAGRAPLVNARFDGVKHRVSAAGNPLLVDGLAWFDCAVDAIEPHGDHAVVFGAVREAGFGDGVEPLVYFDGAYRLLEIG